MKINKSQVSWITYDFANSAYHLLIPTVLFPLIFKNIINNNPETNDLYWSILTSIPIFLAGIITPFLGAYLDKSANNKKFFIIVTSFTIILTFLLGITAIDYAIYLAIFFAMSLFFFNLSQFSYNSLLSSQDIKDNFATVSGIGWGLGYLGGILCMIPVYFIIKGAVLPNDIQNYQNAFLVVGAFYLLFTLPSFIFLKNTSKNSKSNNILPYRKVFNTIKQWKENKNIFKFLLGIYLINDGLSTLVFFTSLYASTTLEMTTNQIMFAFLIVQVVAIPATIIFSIRSEKIGYMKVLLYSIVLWIIIAFSFQIVNSAKHLYILSIAVGLVIGTTPSLARAILAKVLNKKNNNSEFFGFHTFASRISAVIGPLLFGLVSSYSGSQSMALSSLIIFFILGFILLKDIDFKELNTSNER